MEIRSGANQELKLLLTWERDDKKQDCAVYDKKNELERKPRGNPAIILQSYTQKYFFYYVAEIAITI